jgi:hypothetical protein
MLACMLAINFFRGAFSVSWLEDSTWSGSDFEDLIISRSKDFIKFVTLTRDTLLCSENPWVMLQVRIELGGKKSIVLLCLYGR